MIRKNPHPLSSGATTGAVLLAAGLMAWTGAAAGERGERLEQIEQELARDRAKAAELEKTAAALHAEIDSLQQDMVAAAKRAQDLEDQLSDKERVLVSLEKRQAEKSDALHARQEQLARTLGALQRIALSPPEAALVAPRTPIDTARTALLLSTAVPAIEQRAESIRVDLAALSNLHEIIAQERRDLATANLALTEEQLRLNKLIERKRGLEDVATAEQRAARARARKLASEAKDLRDFVAKLEQESQERELQRARQVRAREALETAERAAREAAEEQALSEQAVPEQAEPDLSEAAPAETEQAEATAPNPEETQQAQLIAPEVPKPLVKPGNIRSFPARPSAANLVMPARGRLVIQYGDRDAEEPAASKGISIRTRGFAQVVAPYDGRVAYAGEFRGYGQILIIEHGGRYHTLLAGLDRIDAIAGQWVLAGEPVGLMGRAETDDPVLYLELRKTGQPINPLPWFATTDSKVQG